MTEKIIETETEDIEYIDENEINPDYIKVNYWLLQDSNHHTLTEENLTTYFKKSSVKRVDFYRGIEKNGIWYKDEYVLEIFISIGLNLHLEAHSELGHKELERIYKEIIRK